jgi:hypothetical protein
LQSYHIYDKIIKEQNLQYLRLEQDNSWQGQEEIDEKIKEIRNQMKQINVTYHDL